MNPDLDKLQPYPFERIRILLNGVSPPDNLTPISFAIGEPRHPAPTFVLEAIRAHLDQLSVYPSTRGLPALRQAIVDWLNRRFGIGSGWLDAERHVLPVNGTREALFAFAQAVVNGSADQGGETPLVATPNPFYQIYEGATYLAGASPYLINCTEDNRFLPDFAAVPAGVWQRCQLLYICTPGNPTGAVLDLQCLKQLIELADEYDFVIASDECYSEIYFDEEQPPPGLLQACADSGRSDFKRCVVFHSLSKRSNLPGLRSGFVAGDAGIIEKFLLYRTYHGCAMPVQHQLASIAAWRDEHHVRDNRQTYRDKFQRVLEILTPVLPVQLPDAGFYLWPLTPIADDIFTRQLMALQNVAVVPGSFLGRNTPDGNPGANRIRMALVAEARQCLDGAHRIRRFVETL